MSPETRVHEDAGEMSLAAAAAASSVIRERVRAAGRCSLVLSGGSTPRTFHRLLASRFRDEVPWQQVHIFWSDERYVPHDDERSNYGMARETLLDHVPCPPENVHPMPTHLADADSAAREHEAELRTWFTDGRPRFDLSILGMGDDGHTASLFPNSPSLAETTRLVLAVPGPAVSPLRLTLTLPALNAAANTYFLVQGRNKAAAVSAVLSGNADSSLFPAAAVQPAEGTVTWWLDRESAERLGEG
jgi:6-phosphogluconolactonase